MRKTLWVALLTLLVPPLASATVLDFGTGGGGPGGIVIDTGTGLFGGFNIPVDVLTVFGTPSHDDSYNVDDGIACAGDNGTCGSLNFEWDANTSLGDIWIYGSVPDLGVGYTTLLEGTFTTFTFTPQPGGASIFATGPDVKDADLLTALDIDPATPFRFFGFTLSVDYSYADADCNEAGYDCYTPVSTDIANTAVPEPGTLLLMGAGLLGLVRRARRRNNG